jgi:hypothetical protein
MHKEGTHFEKDKGRSRSPVGLEKCGGNPFGTVLNGRAIGIKIRLKVVVQKGSQFSIFFAVPIGSGGSPIEYPIGRKRIQVNTEKTELRLTHGKEIPVPFPPSFHRAGDTMAGK